MKDKKTEKNEDVDNDENASVTLGSEKDPETKETAKVQGQPQKPTKTQKPAQEQTQKTTVRRLKH